MLVAPEFLPGMDPACRACVIVPVRNEVERVGRALTALAGQVRLDGQRLKPHEFEVLILLNNCTDGSARAVRKFAARNPALRLHIREKRLHSSLANIGYVRKLLMDEACRRFLSIRQPSGAILSTDADSWVDPNWIAANLQEIRNGADAVGGRISLYELEYSNLHADVRRNYLRELSYDLLLAELESRVDPVPSDPWPRHHQHFGASLAVTADAYLRVGGVPAVPFLEDVALWHALGRADARLRHSPQVRVQTSARLNGRAAVGLSAHLRRSATRSQDSVPLVDSPAWLESCFRMRRNLRLEWNEIRSGASGGVPRLSFDGLSSQLGLKSATLRVQLRKELPFGLILHRLDMYGRLARKWAPEQRRVPLPQAIESLRSRLGSLRTAAASKEPGQKVLSRTDPGVALTG